MCQPKQASAFRIGANIILQQHPCRVVEMSTSKTGKHGHAKVNFTGIDLFAATKHKEIQGASHPMLTFASTKSEWVVMDLDGLTVTLINDAGDTRDDVALPAHDDALVAELRAAHERLASDDNQELAVTVLSALGRHQIVAYQLRESA